MCDICERYKAEQLRNLGDSTAAASGASDDLLDKPKKHVQSLPVNAAPDSSAAAGTDTGLAERQFPEACAFELSEIGPQGEPIFTRYSEDQPRDPDGKFASGGDLTADKTSAAFGKLGGEKALGKALSSWQMPTGNGKTIGEKTADAIRSGKQNIITAAIRNEHVDTDVHRGIMVPPTSQVAAWERGMSVQVMPSSFSSSSKVALDFSKMTTTADDFYGKSQADWKSVVLHVSKENADDEHLNAISVAGRGAKGFESEKEVITGGRFYVVKAYDVSGTRHIDLVQTGVF